MTESWPLSAQKVLPVDGRFPHQMTQDFFTATAGLVDFRGGKQMACTREDQWTTVAGEEMTCVPNVEAQDGNNMPMYITSSKLHSPQDAQLYGLSLIPPGFGWDHSMDLKPPPGLGFQEPATVRSFAVPLLQTKTGAAAPRAAAERADEPALLMSEEAVKENNETPMLVVPCSSQDDGIAPPPSLGSVGHPHLCNAPCKYAMKTNRGCKDGVNCLHCHLCKWKRKGTYDKAAVPTQLQVSMRL